MLPKSVSIKIEVIDPETGRRVAVMVDGAVPKSLSDSIGKYVSRVLPSRGALAEDGQLGETASEGEPAGSMSFSSTFGQVRFLLVKHFKYGYFTSRDVQDEYEWMLKGRLRSSTVSTYLLRLADPRSGILQRRHGVGGYEFLLRGERIKDEIAQAEKLRSPQESHCVKRFSSSACFGTSFFVFLLGLVAFAPFSQIYLVQLYSLLRLSKNYNY